MMSYFSAFSRKLTSSNANPLCHSIIRSQRRGIQLRSENGIVYAEHRFKTCSIRQIGAFHDNYIYFIRDHQTGCVAVVDAGETAPTLQAIKQFQTTDWIPEYGIDTVLNTHHHNDHIGANLDLKEQFPNIRIIGYNKGKHRLKGCTDAFDDGEIFQPLPDTPHYKLQLVDCGGHTVDHCAFMDHGNNVLFCGDTIFALGCGRVFEGTHKQMYESVTRLKEMCNPDTIMFCAHEYTKANSEFAIQVDPCNEDLQRRYKTIHIQRVNGEWTVPCKFDDELKTNPFLRCDSEAIRSHLGVKKDATDEEVFAALRIAKDNF